MPARLLTPYEPWELYSAGVEAVDHVLGRMGYEATEKAAVGILSRAGYDRAVRNLVRLIAREARGPDQLALRQAAAKLDVDWPNLAPAKRNAIIQAAAESILRVPPIVGPKLRKVIPKEAARVVMEAKKAAQEQHALPFAPAFTEIDQRIVDHAGRSQASYVTDVYGRRSEEFSERARSIVARGMEEGLGRQDIGERLAMELVDPTARKAESYWTMVAAVHTTRARSWGTLSSFTDAGIETYAWEAVNDEATCDVCDFMDGKEFDTGAAVENWEAAEQAEDPTDVEDLQPWISVGEDEEGNRILFADKDGQRHGLARVVRSAEGEKDTGGRYSHGVSAGHLQGLGIDSPPAHGNCRCVLVPA